MDLFLFTYCFVVYHPLIFHRIKNIKPMIQENVKGKKKNA
jgi:hypothetical protein